MMNANRTFIGGPFDGYPVIDTDWDFVVHTFDYNASFMAVYLINDEGTAFMFDGFQPVDEYQNRQDGRKNESRL